ncbi:phosphatases II [Exidia glandulosa HHB12029]|uniref:Phosphatases II n=1 Tax=Exidia glandulosa HHB12029 TaxID=1314781 RepID=A0A165PY09_EXIGL|nr:phosphatases II [Exidia glandulosa HHB12029]
MARGKGKANPTRPAAAQETGHTAVVEPYLHLGPCSAASNEKLLSTAGITHVLSIGATPTKTVPGITYTRLALKDEPTADLAACVAAAAAFIDEARRRKGRVIVHCSAAISRSPAVVAGYLITREGYSLKRALAIIAASRPRIAPNEGFVQQLGDIEEHWKNVWRCTDLWRTKTTRA